MHSHYKSVILFKSENLGTKIVYENAPNQEKSNQKSNELDVAYFVEPNEWIMLIKNLYGMIP